jgi:hypothetical protein
MANPNPNLSSFIWSVADLLRGDYKPSDYGKVILPFTVLRRLDCVLESTKAAVLAEKATREAAGLNPEPFLLRKSGQFFYNTSPLDLKKLMGDQDHIGENLRAYRTITVERPERDASGQVVLGSKGKAKGKPMADSSLRDTENVPLGEDIDAYFKREVLPHAPDAWIDADKTKVGYEIPFNRHFYVFKPPRPLAEIDAELKGVTDRTLALFGTPFRRWILRLIQQRQLFLELTEMTFTSFQLPYHLKRSKSPLSRSSIVSLLSSTSSLPKTSAPSTCCKSAALR